MKAKDILDLESSFNATGVDSDGKHFIQQVSASFPFPLTILTTQQSSGYYKAEAKTKTAICLHFTCGYLPGDIATLTQPDHLVSVPFVVGRNGRVYQLFSSKFWSYHLGANCVGGNVIQSQRTIGIEVSNIGPLIRDGSTMRTIYGDEYCNVSEVQYYKKAPYRGYEYFATFTEGQIESTTNLIAYLCDKYNIPKATLPVPKRYELFTKNEAASFKGICSHANFRADKTDIGPTGIW